MPGSVTSPTAFNAYTNFTLNTLNLNSVMRRLSTGVKGVVDDGAGVAISERMRAQANSTAKARSNVDNGISLLQTADTWLQQVGDMLGRLRELAVDANDATKTSTDRQNIQVEFVGLQAEVKRIITSAAKFNGGLIFSGTLAGTATQVGADSGQVISISLGALTSTAYGTMGGASAEAWEDIYSTAVAVSVASAATDAIISMSEAIDFLSKQRASIGAQQERFEATRAGLLSYEDQIRSAESKIRTVDTARESSEMMKYQILSQIGTAMLAQANQLPAAAVQLVGGR